jgi:tRNA 2-thiouridine synthesizing protein B
MSTLHTVNKSPFATQALISCLNHCKKGDAVLLIEDAVYGGLAGTSITDAVSAKLDAVSIYVLNEDANARGIDASRFTDGITTVDYDGFVDLVTQHARTQSWL